MGDRDYLGYVLKQIHLNSERKLNREIGAKGLTFSQFVILNYLSLNKDKTIYKKDIEKAVKLSHATTMGVLSRLYNKEFIDFCSVNDKRFQQVILTEKGENSLNKIFFIFESHENFMRDIFSSEEYKTLFELLLKLLDGLEEENEKNL